MTEQPDTPVVGAAKQEPAPPSGPVLPSEPDVQPETVQAQRVEVGIVRSVRFGRLLLVGAFIGGVIAVLLTLMRPVDEEALYEMRQIAGFMLVVGATIGLLCGALLALILNIFAKRRQGHGVAMHTDVQ